MDVIYIVAIVNSRCELKSNYTIECSAVVTLDQLSN